MNRSICLWNMLKARVYWAEWRPNAFLEKPMGIKILCSACFTFISKVTRFVISDSGPQFDPQGLGIVVLGFLGVRGLIWEEKKNPIRERIAHVAVRGNFLTRKTGLSNCRNSSFKRFCNWPVSERWRNHSAVERLSHNINWDTKWKGPQTGDVTSQLNQSIYSIELKMPLQIGSCYEESFALRRVSEFLQIPRQ